MSGVAGRPSLVPVTVTATLNQLETGPGREIVVDRYGLGDIGGGAWFSPPERAERFAPGAADCGLIRKVFGRQFRRPDRR